MDLVYIALIAFAGSFIQSLSGFGYAILCMALWPLIIPFRLASILEVITAFAMVIYISARLFRHINFKLLVFPLLSSFIASTFGVFTLMASSETAMRRVLGGLLVVLSVYFVFFGNKVRLKPTVTNGLLAGVLSGFFAGMLNIGGPPIVAYFLSVTEDKKEYNATLQCYFAITTVYIFFVHLLAGNVTGDLIRLGTAGFAGVAVGTVSGLCLFRKLSLEAIKKVVYSFMTVAGTYLLIKG